ncbi:cytochrome P450 9e2-like [Odontomachus brunneus]|uniref:cytochrome P450 9e2-like n=1 Tax=Odontomachus brunneus TaxID=486640 RepID=UPI0013F190A7|nr:cytochrome P450 9e2-like [Odontomachus brunneus]
MEFWTILLSTVIGLLGIHYLFRKFNYFNRNGIIHVPSVLILGDMAAIIFRRISFANFLQKLYYYKPNAKYFGFGTLQPVILLRDPELIKEIFIKNFDSFPNRQSLSEFNDILFSKNLSALRGQKWRDVRALLSPAFTSSKMKTMYTLMTECAVNFVKTLSYISAKKSDMDMKNIFSKYTNDVIATCAFGIKVDSMNDPNNNFHHYGKEATNFIRGRAFKFMFVRTFPKLSNLLRLRFLSNDATNFFRDVIQTTIATRDAKNITRPDMIQLMMDMRGKHENERELSIDDMVAQAFVFFLGGFETSSIAMSFIAHEVAANPDVQAKLWQEIDEVLENSNGEVTYETINGLKYLDAVISEVLRLYPPAVFIERQCERPYELPPALPTEKSIILKKGQLIWVPIYAIHRDEKYYDEPEKFCPERFFDKNSYYNSPCYAPFGLGPRMCIANRFALLEIKVLMFHLLSQCELKPCAKTTLPMKLSKKGLAMMPEGGFCIHHLFRRFNYFKRNGIIHVSPVLVIGGMASVLFRRISLADYLHKLYYYKPNAKYFGFYATSRPVILLRDSELIKEIFIKNFDSFPNRRGLGEFNDILFSKNLFSLRGQKWRDVRTLLSPAFTSSKMKTMYNLMTECAVDFVKALSYISADKSDMDMKDVFSKYTNDVIATCAFGIKVDSMNDSINNFYLHGKEATSFLGTRALKFFFVRTFPTLSNLLRLRFLSENTTNFFKDIIQTTIATRDAKNITRPDMIQLMMDIRGKRENERELSIDDMVAQAFVFFLGGFETTSTAMSFIAHELAANPDIQAKLQHEIDEVLENSDGEVTYETINGLKYLDAVISEVLRLYPPAVFIERQCDRPYELPPALPSEKSIILKKDQLIWVPIYAIHRDEKYYDEPEKFRPERFFDKNSYYNSPCYAPFGLGPRMCIANRFALLEIKVLMFHLLSQCDLKPCAKTTLPVKLSKKGLALMPENGFWLKVQRRNNI